MDSTNKYYYTRNEQQISNSLGEIHMMLDGTYLNFKPFGATNTVLPGLTGFMGNYEPSPSIDDKNFRLITDQFEKFMIMDMVERSEEMESVFTSRGLFPTVVDEINHSNITRELSSNSELEITEFISSETSDSEGVNVSMSTRTSTTTRILAKPVKMNKSNIKRGTRKTVKYKLKFNDRNVQRNYNNMVNFVGQYHVSKGLSPRDRLRHKIVNSLIERLRVTFTRSQILKISFKYSDEIFRKHWVVEFNKEARGNELISSLQSCVSHFVRSRYRRSLAYNKIIQKVLERLDNIKI